MHMNTCIYTCTHAQCIHTVHIHAYHVYIQTCSNINTYHMYICTYTCIHMYTHAYEYTHTFAHMCTYIHTRTHTQSSFSITHKKLFKSKIIKLFMGACGNDPIKQSFLEISPFFDFKVGSLYLFRRKERKRKRISFSAVFP